MKLALITDIHANREALSAVLAHAEGLGVQRYAFLGDYVGYGADPGWVVDRVREFVAQGSAAVLGNHDAAVVRGPTPSMRLEPRQAIEWTRAQLGDEQVAFLAARPYAVTEDDRLYVHANAYAPMEWGYIVGRHDAARSLLCTASRYTFCGHVHEPCLYHLSSTGKTGEFRPTPEVDIPVPPHRQWLVLPGSAGQPRDGNPAACYATMDLAQAQLTFHRVPYDHDAAADKIRAAGLPTSFADRLVNGQ
ncbi:metallophosphoesterase family protein [Ideonella sp. BN130291]|uniref:metallophosphoesterase family protein n=1 Tax=Ideonella sp. BN130291 TaxID=3112940 RepID=UPI002E252B23|nr:metallophosphoesterase family protein [Ideonella sp. BN130291]